VKLRGKACGRFPSIVLSIWGARREAAPAESRSSESGTGWRTLLIAWSQFAVQVIDCQSFPGHLNRPVWGFGLRVGGVFFAFRVRFSGTRCGLRVARGETRAIHTFKPARRFECVILPGQLSVGKRST